MTAPRHADSGQIILDAIERVAAHVYEKTGRTDEHFCRLTLDQCDALDSYIARVQDVPITPDPLPRRLWITTQSLPVEIVCSMVAAGEEDVILHPSTPFASHGPAHLERRKGGRE